MQAKSKSILSILIGIIVVSALVSYIVLFKNKVFDNSTSNKQSLSPSPSTTNIKNEKIRFGMGKTTQATLIVIANEMKFFEKEGLDIEIKEYDSGKPAFDDMLLDKVDYSAPGHAIVAEASLNRSDFKVLTSIASSNNFFKILTRKDKNIVIGRDLKGKKVGVTKESYSPKYLKMFLDANAINENEVEKVFADINTSTNQLLNGEIDALVAGEPYASIAAEKLGQNALLLSQPGLFTVFNVLAARDDVLNVNPQNAEKILRALIKASDYLYLNKDAAHQIVAKHYNLDIKQLDILTKDFDYNLSLNQNLLLSMENDLNWSVSFEGNTQANFPNFLNILYEKPLKNLLPNNVDIIR